MTTSTTTLPARSMPLRALRALCLLMLLAFAAIPAARAQSADSPQAAQPPQATQSQTPPPVAPPQAAQPAPAQASPGQVSSGQASSGQVSSGQASPGQVDAAPAPGDGGKLDAPAAAPAAQALPVPRQGEAEQVDAWKLALDQIEIALQREGLTEAEMLEFERQLEPIRNQANDVVGKLAPQLKAQQDRLKQLTPASDKETGNTNEGLSSEREQQQAAVDRLEATVRKGRLVSVLADQLLSRVAERRRDRFARTLFEKRRSILAPSLWSDGLGGIPRVYRSTRIILGDALAVMSAPLLGDAMLPVALSLLAGIVIIVAGRLAKRRFVRRRPDTTPTNRLDRLSAAAWFTLVNGLFPTVALIIVMATLQSYQVLPERLDGFANALVGSIALAVFITALARAVLAPNSRQWRLVDLPDATVAPTLHSIMALAGLLLLQTMLSELYDLTAAPLSVSVLTQGIMSIAIALTIMFALIRIIRARTAAALGEGLTVNERRWRWLRGFIWAALFVVVASAAAGYIAISGFLATQIVFAGIIAAVLSLLIGLNDEITSTLIGDERGLDAALAQNLGLKHGTIEQISILTGGVIRFLLIVIAGVLLLLPWGFDTREWRAWVEKAFFGFQVGDIEISLSEILFALLLFGVGMLATRAFQRWLGESYLPHTRLDLGLRNSIRTAVGYLGIAGAAMFAITYIGLSLENLAIVAGALSLGIGFGLQSVVNNFVSGLILLAERPIKEGDWVRTANAEGNVRRISIRATEIETFDRATVIVPNSDLISGTVTNMMHNNRMGRLVIPIGVGYASDADQVRDILTACAERNPEVLGNPAPRVYFRDFGASSLDFALYVYLRDVDNTMSVKSDLHFDILREFRAAGIEIPFPQHDVNLRDIERIERALSGARPKTGRARKGDDT
ncbi:MAG: DUF3772 domain-containing protein [Flavobacteriaceae bacterium]